MKVKDLIDAALKEVGIVGTVPTGTQTKYALSRLGLLLSWYNSQEYLTFTRRIATAEPGHFAYVFATDQTLVPSDDKCRAFGDPCFISAATPQTISAAAYRTGNTWVPIDPDGFADLLTKMVMMGAGIPSFYAYERSKDFGVVFFSRPPIFPVRFAYNAEIAPLTLDGTVEAPGEYEGLFLYGLAARLAKFYHAPAEEIARLSDTEGDYIRVIKEREKHAHFVTYGEGDDDNFMAILRPRGW